MNVEEKKKKRSSVCPKVDSLCVSDTVSPSQSLLIMSADDEVPVPERDRDRETETERQTERQTEMTKRQTAEITGPRFDSKKKEAKNPHHTHTDASLGTAVLSHRIYI